MCVAVIAHVAPYVTTTALILPSVHALLRTRGFISWDNRFQ